ncbi:MAG TPA: hypothetical protein VFD60_05955 [Nitrososphaeraceae archaeon]|jgi:hypothetical protein|nr:hypothetical protein [Nitrososphaeraceae archaeon]
MEDKRDKILDLSLAKECCSMKFDLLTNVTVVDVVIRFVSSSIIPKGNQNRLLTIVGVTKIPKNPWNLIIMKMKSLIKKVKKKQEKETREIAIKTTASQVF